MRRITTGLALALCLLGCGTTRPGIGFDQDLDNNRNCIPDKFLVGQLVIDPAIAIQDDQGLKTTLIWPSSYALHWSPGLLTGQFEIVDDAGKVIAVTGHRYRIGGTDFIAAGGFWACAAVIPQ
jgi:hypothetical protein